MIEPIILNVSQAVNPGNPLNPNWFMVFATLFLGFIALFEEKIKSWWFKPKLKVDFDISNRADCHKTTFTNLQTGTFISDTYYFRFRVENEGNLRAEHIEATADKLYIKDKHGEFKENKHFQPLNLVWSHFRTSQMPINPGMYRFCDIGHATQTTGGNPTHEVSFDLDVACQVNTNCFKLDPGEYVLRVLVSSPSQKQVLKKYFKIKIKDKWFSDEEKMLGKGISIECLKL